MTKSLPVSKWMVYNSYLKVCEKNGSAGIDNESIEMFNEKLSDNLYKIWNRITSGSYFPPPVRAVFIARKQGGERPLGIPTVSDRIAQGVVKDYLEPLMEKVFHNSSFGYRPGRSAHDALVRCHENCKIRSWVLDVDIKGYFDNISHNIMMGLMEQHTQEKWVMLYIERWLKAGVEQKDGSIAARTKGRPQGGVISPLLANIYLHHGFDMWMDKEHAQCPFERYADDIIIHCSTKDEAETLLAKLKARMGEYGLTLHPDKTRIVYCKDERRNENNDKTEESFTFLSYSFQPRAKPDRFGRKKKYVEFSGAISNIAKSLIRKAIRGVMLPRWSDQTLGWFAEKLNPKIRGWVNYYTRYNRREALGVFTYLNELIRKWISNKYKLHSHESVYMKYKQIQAENAELFCHWKPGIKL